MKTLLFSMLALVGFNSFGQTDIDCFKEIKKSEWNYSICIDTLMGVDMTNETELIIKQYEESKTAILTITIDYNNDNQSLQELWKKEFGGKNNDGFSLIDQKDSILNSGKNQFYLVRSFFENDKNELLASSSAIGLYKNQYYSFQTVDVGTEDSSFEFLYKVLNRTSFYGDPKLTNDQKIKEDFLNTLTSGINKEDELQKILLTAEIVVSIAPKEEKESITKALPQIQTMMARWNQSVYDYIEEMKGFESVTIKNYNFKTDNSQPNITAYKAIVYFDCDGKGISYQLVCMEINGLMYLGKMVRK